jgi:hypothetical protein
MEAFGEGHRGTSEEAISCTSTMKAGKQLRLFRHTDKAACSLRLTSLSRIVASSYSEELGVEIFGPWQKSSMD